MYMINFQQFGTVFPTAKYSNLNTTQKNMVSKLRIEYHNIALTLHVIWKLNQHNLSIVDCIIEKKCKISMPDLFLSGAAWVDGRGRVSPDAG